MRQPVDAKRVRHFMRAFGEEAEREINVYLTGGASAVLLGFRPSTIDIDLKIEPDSERLWRTLPRLKERLQINIELTSPGDFIPELPHWRERSAVIAREGPLSFYHYDFYAQVLAKIERGHSQDLADVRQLLSRQLVEAAGIELLFSQIEPNLYRFPALDPPTFRRAVEEVLAAAP
jgi:hypothetical protein